jgi:RNA polymerase sigma factor (sigma-70 family)
MTSGELPADPWPLIERTMTRVARRHALSADEAEDFTSWARVRLLEGGSPLSKFRGQSTVETFLGVVVLNLFRDYRIAKWGKWRPSAAARRLGPAAIRLETLMFRDGLNAGDAVAMVSSQLAGTLTSEEVEALAERLPARLRPRLESEDALRDVPSPVRAAERDVVARELEPKARTAEQALRAALGALPPQDRLILKLRFQEGLKVVEIARCVGVPAKTLYPRLERCVAELRRVLEQHGVGADDVRRLLDWEDLDLSVDYQVERGEERADRGRRDAGGSPPRNQRMSV